MLEIKAKVPNFDIEWLGMLPLMVSEHNPAPAREQFDDMYQHGGGWRTYPGFTMRPDGSLRSQYYPEDADLPMLAEAKLRDETIRFYESAWVAIVQPDGALDVARLD